MSRWVDARWFGPADYGGTTPGATGVVNNGNVSEDSMGVSSSTTPPVSGSIPSIGVGIDYRLRDSSGEVITDETGASISLEGLSA